MAVDYDYLLPSPTLDTGYKASSAHDFLLTTTSLLSNPILTSKEHHSYFMWRRSSAKSFTAFSTHGWISAFYSLEYEMRCWHARRLHRTSKRWLWHFIFRDRYGCNYVLGPIYQGHLSALSKRAECLWMVLSYHACYAFIFDLRWQSNCCYTCTSCPRPQNKLSKTYVLSLTKIQIIPIRRLTFCAAVKAKM